MSIRSQDDYELLECAKRGLRDIHDITKEMKRRGRRLVFVHSFGKVANEIEPRDCQLKLEVS